MSFHQLKLLLWKNLVIRKRSKVRVVAELVWPLFLFLILMWVRTRELKEYRHQCHFEDRALPSAGSLTFVQSLLCTFNNTCHERVPPPRNNVLQDFDLTLIDRFATDLEEVLRQEVNPATINAAKTVKADLNSTLRAIWRLHSDTNFTVPVRNLVDEAGLRRLIQSKALNVTENFVPELLAASYNFSNFDEKELEQLMNGPSSLCEPNNIVGDRLVTGTSREASSLLRDDLCSLSKQNLSVFSILSVLQPSSLASTLVDLLTERLESPPHPETWIASAQSTASIVAKVRELESLEDMFQELRKTSLGRSINSILCNADANSTGSAAFVNVLGRLLCGSDESNRSFLATSNYGSSVTNQFQEFRSSFEKKQTAGQYDNDTDVSPQCAELFTILETNPESRFLWQIFKPFVRGKILFVPDNPPVRQIMENVNKTFQPLENIMNLSQRWLDSISPRIRDIIEQVEENWEPLWNVTDDNEAAGIIAEWISNQGGDKLDLWKQRLDQMDNLAFNLTTYIGCFDFNRFEGFATEEEALERGVPLMENQTLWAVIIFDEYLSDRNETRDQDELPEHLIYRIRMDSERVDSTKSFRDRFDTGEPRRHPLIDMKYFTSGFIYLQDMIEQSVIRMRTGRSSLPATYMQQFPSPCHIHDTFFMAISRTFPMFMVLSFVYTCAMIVKSIVFEKEMRLKETMRIMGLENGVHWAAWFIDSFLSMAVSCAVLTIILVFGKVIEKSDPTLVFVFLLCFCIATICKSFLISTLFGRANLAAACGGIIYFVLYLPYTFLVLWENHLNFYLKIFANLLSNVAFGFGCSYFAHFEEAGTGAQWTSWSRSPIEGDAYSLMGCMIMMLSDAVLYYLLTWYIEAVLPGQYGVPRPWYFPLQRSYWFPSPAPKKRTNDDLDNLGTVAPLNEEEPANLRKGIRVSNLGKVYPNGKVALRNLSLTFYQDQITAFLGHNGAGKTTTISILTGLYPPSQGTAFINDHDIRTDMRSARKDLGLCPQHNILFNQLTVEEQIWFYARLKGRTDKEVELEMEEFIQDLNLSHKKNALAKHLSGGMQRKLSIAMAFIGGSKIVILDEPTAGVDPYSRRSIWDLLLKYKKDRTVILTTHFMDEADLLGDRIAIISEGQLRCCGSSLFLKRKFGLGYYLTLVRNDSQSTSDTEDSGLGQSQASLSESPASSSSSTTTISIPGTQLERISGRVKHHIANGVLLENVGSDIVFCLPYTDAEGADQRQNLGRLLDDLDQSLKLLGVSSYGLSDTTLEEIFLKVADGSVPDDGDQETVPPVSSKSRVLVVEDKSGLRTRCYSQVPQIVPREEVAAVGAAVSKVTGRSLVGQQFQALYYKRFHNARRNIKGLVCEIVLPPFFVALAMAFTLVLPPLRPEPALVASPWLYGDSNVAFFARSGNPKVSMWPAKYADEILNRTGMGTRCLDGEPLGLGCLATAKEELVTDISVQQDSDCTCYKGAQTCPAPSNATLIPAVRTVTNDVFFDLSRRNISNWILRTLNKFRFNRYGGFELGARDLIASVNLTLAKQSLERISKASGADEIAGFNPVENVEEWETEAKLRGTFDSVKIWYNNKGWASSIAYLNAVNNAILRGSLPRSLRDNSSHFGITVINHPMNYTKRQLQNEIMHQSGVSLLHAISVIFALSFVPASFVVFLVEERVSKAKHLQYVAGVTPLTYWIAHYTWDLVNYLASCVLCVLIFLIFDEKAYVSEANLPGLILLLVLYGVASIPLMYPASLIFSVPSSAFVALACANLFIGFVTTISTFVLELFNDAELKFIASILQQVFLVFPQYCLGRGLMDMAATHIRTESLQAFGVETERSIFEWTYLGRNFLCLLVQGLVFFALNIALQYRVLQPLQHLRTKKGIVKELALEDEDVARERNRVEKGESNSDVLRLLRLTKIYPGHKTPAVDRLSLGVAKGECFGLLGVNGAGKSSTFKMLTGDIPPTSGDALVNGYSIRTQLDNVRQNLGYCPQSDAIHPLMTGREHLYFYAKVRGIPSNLVEKVVEEGLIKLGLQSCADRCAGTYSGGNKRKLSTAIALIGDPAVVFLDEPSSGMDPKARRSLWNAVLEAVRNAQSVVLTSHSMEECQVLCTRLAIMVNGTLRCLGSPQHLKNRFGSGYMMTVRCRLSSVDQVLGHVTSVLPEAQLRERRHNQLIYQLPLPQNEGTMTLSAVFEIMEAARLEVDIEDYSISQTTLDEVFIRFASLQRSIGDQESSLESHEDPENGLIPLGQFVVDERSTNSDP